MQKILLLFFINATDIHDFKELYAPFIDKRRAYHPQPHQFRIKRFNKTTVLLHYKQWCHSKHWLPIQSIERVDSESDITGSSVSANSTVLYPQKKKQRKMTRWTTTAGQRICKARLVSSPLDSMLPNSSSSSISSDAQVEVIFDDSGKEDGVFDMSDSDNADPNTLEGILWISNSPDLSAVRRISFKQCTVIENQSLAGKIFSDIQNKFARVLPEFFTSEVMQNWHDWMQKQQKLWDPAFHEANPILYSEMPLPRNIVQRISALLDSPSTAVSLQDSAKDDLPDDMQIITFNSGTHGSFTKGQRLELLRQCVPNLPECSNTAIICEGKGCIFKYTHVKRGSDEECSQIGVGIIQKVHGDPSSPSALIDIRFCPPKGAKPQKGSRLDTLYQDTNVDMNFNLKYKSRQGKKVEEEDEKLDREVLLAFNLDINKSTGGFNKQNFEAGSGMSSYQVAADVIELFNASKF